MQFSRQNLVTAVATCLPGIDRSMTLIQGTDTVVFGDNTIHTYNDHIAISVPFESDLSGAVKATEFHRLLSKLPGDIVEITPVPDANQWKVSAGKITADFSLMESQITTHLQALKLHELEWKAIPADFATALNLCSIQVNSNSFRGIYVAGNEVLSTDSVRINRYTFPEGTNLESFWIEDSAGREIASYGNSITHYSLGIGWVHFKAEDGTIISTRRRDSAGYPAAALSAHIARHIKSEGDMENSLPADLAESVDRASIFGMESRSMAVVKLEIRPNAVTLSADRSIGKYKEECPWEVPFTGEVGLEVWVDASFLKEAVTKVRNFYVKMAEIPVLVFHSDSYMQITNTQILGTKK